ncbi:NAD(P)/FAD-dependent oxidoreductase [Rhodococcoides fascians]|uniref:NAD(P)/FAD-dependent oxidoreductase n=1 Tax=Rhodococcoides fascians TaxID=1828 RepID=UPI00050BF0FD|nr:FAD-binding oxidoreductase [Rhodococcus fascians]
MELSSIPTRESERSFWLREALAAEDAQVTELSGTVNADVCIVGGGFTGLWTAIELKQRDSSTEVVVLEAQLCGSGASGTNAGMVMNLWPKFGALKAHVGETEAVRIAGQTSDAIDDIEKFVRDHDLVVGFQRQGWLWGSTAINQDGAWDEAIEDLGARKGNPFQTISAERAQELGGTGIRGGVVDPTSATVQPAALARGLRRVALELGVKIFERTFVHSIEGMGRPLVTTAKGSVKADSVVLAINAWASNLGWMRKVLITTASDNLVTEKLPERVMDQIGTPGVGVSDSRRLLNYWRTTSDGRFLFGKGGVGLGFGARGSSSMFGEPPNPKPMLRNWNKMFPGLSDLRIENSWRAPVEYSLNSLPFFVSDQDHPRVFIATGYSGDGVGPSRLGARILASMATDAKDEWADSGLTRMPSGWVPPEPFRFVGGQVVRRALISVDDAQSEGRRPNPVAVGLTKLDPTSWI